MAKNTKKSQESNQMSDKALFNSLTDFVIGLGLSRDFGVQLSQTATLIKNNRYYFLSEDRNTLSYMYSTHGIVQTLIDQPVEDAFRGGIKIESDELDIDDIQKIENYMRDNDIIETIKDLEKWKRLYGGGGMVINTIGKSTSPLNIEAIKENTPLDFYAADLWELSLSNTNTYAEQKPYVKNTGSDWPYLYYGNRLHKSRVLKAIGKKAPSFTRPNLRGWGMSEVERLVRSINQYLKNNDLIFELLDEAKVDVYRVNGFASTLMQPNGTKKVIDRFQLVNQQKNYHSSVVMDKEDEYEQKQMNFSGLAEMLNQIRIGIASDVKMPLTKLFGLSATGFSSGEDSLENYNSMIESEIRGKADQIIIQMLKLISKKVLDFIPEDLRISYNPLRVLSELEEENIKTQKYNRLMGLYDRGLMDEDNLNEQLQYQQILIQN